MLIKSRWPSSRWCSILVGTHSDCVVWKSCTAPEVELGSVKTLR